MDSNHRRNTSYVNSLLAKHEAVQQRYQVIEAPKVLDYGRARKRSGKSDPFDAQAIATAAVVMESTQQRFPRLDNGARASLRVLLGAREQMTLERTAKINALTALLRSVDLDVDARTPLSATHIEVISHWRRRDEELSLAVARNEAKRFAQCITVLDIELKKNRVHLTEIFQATPAAALLEEVGGRTCQRCDCLYRVVSFGQSPIRNCIRCTSRSQSHPGFIREYRAAPLESRRRPSTEQCLAHGRGHQNRPRLRNT